MQNATNRPNAALTGHDAAERVELRDADALAEEGRYLAAIDLLTAANHRQRDADIEERLVALRCAAVAELEPSSPRQPWPPSCPDPFPEVHGRPPEISADRLDTAYTSGAILHHGCLAVRGLIDPKVVARLVADIDLALDGLERWKTDPTARSDFFRPFDPGQDRSLHQVRAFVAGHHCVLVTDAPTAMFELLDALQATNVLECIEGHLGERPLMSMHKSTFRLSRPSTNITGWHQDGAFIGDGARAINIWIPLTDCGGSALVPGLDLIPRRFEEVFEPTPPPLANQVPGNKVMELGIQTRPVRPEFRAGDALLFDELLVHSTGRSDDMNANRYGIEFWMFAPSTFPSQYLPMVI